LLNLTYQLDFGGLLHRQVGRLLALKNQAGEMARHYARGADLKRKMRGGVASFDREVNRRRTKPSNRSDPSVKPDAFLKFEGREK
jgi:hypothetical protein